MVNDAWVGAAMTNDMVVVEFLVHLRQSQAAPKSHHLTTAAPLSWGLKQPRSRLTARWKDTDSTRCSPTTPLSWSGAASPSDGCEESSRPSLVSQQAPRSKAAATATSECTGSSASTKRCRKHKEIATLSTTFEEQRARNESLKRIKLDLGATSKNSRSSTGGENTVSKVQTQAADDPQTDSKAGRSESCGESGFLIPDLNMTPCDGDSSFVE